MTDTAEAARTRRRWINLGEIIAIAALLISAAGLWDSHQQRARDEGSAKSQAVAKRAPLVLIAKAGADGRILRLAPADQNQVIQTQTLIFPAVLAVAPADTTGNARIESAWFESALRGGIKGSARPVRRLPVGVVTRYIVDGEVAEDHAVYDVGFSTHSRLLRPDAVTLEGLMLAARGVKDVQARVDARWLALHSKA